MDFIATGFSLKAAYLASSDRRGPNEPKAVPSIYLIPKGYRLLVRDMTMPEQAATDTRFIRVSGGFVAVREKFLFEGETPPFAE
jgi:hypothetical protein